MMTARTEVEQVENEEKKIYKIDLDTRVVMVPAGEVIGVYHDKDVNRLTFEVPGIYKGIDLTGYQISINYMNEEEQKDVYLVEDMLVTMNMNNKPESIQFSWLVGATACAMPGTVGFTVCFKKLDSEGNILNEINTKLTKMKVLEGCEAVEDEIEERYMTDLAGQLYKELDKVKKRGSDVKKRLAAVITEKGVETASGDGWDVVIGNAEKIPTGGYVVPAQAISANGAHGEENIVLAQAISANVYLGDKEATI
nr:MAG TPA: hypothetical protein [Bacteriophage sp.]